MPDMNAPDLSHLEIKCLHAAHELLALDWGSSAAQVRKAVDEVIIGPPRDALALKFLIGESAKLPAQFEPARRLHDLIEAAAQLHSHNRRAANFVRLAQGAA